MKMTRKLMALLLAAMMLLTLCACGKEAVDISGKYYATSCIIDGEEYSCDGEYVLLDEDGTGKMMFMEEEYPIKKWTLSDSDFTFTLEDGDKFVGTYEDGVLDGTIAGMDYVFDMNGATASKKGPATKAEETDEAAETEAETETEAAPAAAGGVLAEGDLGNYHVAVVGVEEFTDAAGDPAVRLYYDFTNNSDERTGGSDISVTAKQSGFELVSTYALSQDDVPEYGNEYLYVYPGVTIRCIEELGYNPEAGGTIVFTLEDYWASDDTLTVEVDATDLPGAPAEPLEIVPVTDPHTTDGWATEGEYDDCYFTLLDYEVVEADSYSDCDQVIRFYFEYTNNGSEAESAWWNSNFSAYQDGIQLSTDSADDRVDADELYHEDIEPGETVTCAVCFGIRSDSPVELMLIDVWDDIYIGQRADIG